MTLQCDKNRSDIIKGFAIILVILHHYFYEATEILPIWMFNGAGAMACSLFFFLSAYGLSASGKINADSNYWTQRIKKLIYPMIVANTLLVLYCCIFRNYEITVYTLTDIIGITSLNHPIWFMQVLVLMYIALWASHKIKCNQVICCFCIGMVYTLITHRIGCLSWIAFPIGLLVFNREINYHLYKILGLLWLPSYAFYVYNDCKLNTLFLILNFIFSIISVISIIGVCCSDKKNTQRRNKLRVTTAIKWLGVNSIYPYLLHATVIYIVSDRLGLNSWFSFLTFVLLMFLYTTAFTYCMRKLTKNIIK